MHLDFHYLINIIPQLLKYLPIVLFIAFCSFFFAVVIGIVFSIIIERKIPVIYYITLVLVSFFRGVPSLVQIFILYFGLPQLVPALSSINAMTAVIMALSIRNAAYLSEVFRSALISVDPGQYEAALSVSMTRRQAYWKVIFPQAARIAIPPSGTFLIMILKDTSLAFTIGVVDMFAQAKLMAAASYNFLESYLAIGLIYWVLTAVISLLQSVLEKYISRPYRRV
ncbi:amino acid ABC transporter permease [Tatumella citrea]|uniref:ABC transporter permease n=1 Tax=Tatumella citrea TaxID=53336 RepID=A0A1Y0LE45_TATCI|nr:amino acid ABC transporter permease [Tatumella citrea]ARU95910.1 ABC transporter permease [Tatumella citrea]ARU99950.1 ABC transporter permease [Tatumella citrea]